MNGCIVGLLAGANGGLFANVCLIKKRLLCNVAQFEPQCSFG
jgi:hypothetical protein